MNAKQIIHILEREGFRLEANSKLAFTCRSPLTERHFDILERHKPELVAYLLTGQTMVPRLPWHLDRLVHAATIRTLTFNVEGVPDVNRYVCGLACAYLRGDCEGAQASLQQLYDAWQR